MSCVAHLAAQLIILNSLMHQRQYILFILLSWPFLSQGQGSSLQVISGSVCEGLVETPVLAQQLQGIASVSLKVNYDTNEVRFLGVRNLHPAMSNALVTSNNSQFIMAWFSLSPAQLTNDTMVVLRWEGRPTGTTSLQFDVQTPGNCEITNLQGLALSVQFVDGVASVRGATPPAPRTARQLFGVTTTAYQFMYTLGACMQQVVFQTARDSSFTNIHQSGLAMTDSFALADFSDLRPSQGDSVVWWRFGGVFNADTAWSSTGRMSFALQLSTDALAEDRALKVYPNPFREGFWIEIPVQFRALPMELELRALHGQLLASFEVPVGHEAFYYQPQTYLPLGIISLFWRNSLANGHELLKKLPY